MKKIIFGGLVLFLIWIYSLESCVHDPILNPGDGSDTIKIDTMKPIDTIKPVPDKICDTTVIYFNRDILPIFVQNCAILGCHDSRTGSDGYILTDYQKIIRKGLVSGKPNNSEIYKVITSNNQKEIMPPPPSPKLSTKQINLINKWITGGIKNDTCTDVIACDTTSVKFTSFVLPLFQKHCISCHGSLVNYAGIVLHTYSGVNSALATGRLMGSMTWESGFTQMPLDQPKLPDCDIKKLQIWISKGALNN